MFIPSAVVPSLVLPSAQVILFVSKSQKLSPGALTPAGSVAEGHEREALAQDSVSLCLGSDEWLLPVVLPASCLQWEQS